MTLSSNTSTYQVTTASVPSHDAGEFRLEAVPQGTYTLSISRNGVSPVSRIVDLTAGQVWNEPTLLPVAASVSGQVMLANGPAGSGWVVEMYRSSQYPEVVLPDRPDGRAGRLLVRRRRRARGLHHPGTTHSGQRGERLDDRPGRRERAGQSQRGGTLR